MPLSLKFLGLILDNNLPLEPHIKWLHVKYGNLRFRKVYLEGRGAEIEYVCLSLPVLICPKKNYASYVYDSATKSKISKTGYLHNGGIRLATATSCASRLDSLNVKSEKLLSLRRNLILFNYAAKMPNFNIQPNPTTGMW